MSRTIALLLVVGLCGTARGAEPADVRTAISKGVGFLADKGIDWKEDRKCSSCHHIPYTLWGLNEVKKAGYEVDDKVLADLTAWVLSPDDPGKVFPKLPEPTQKPEPPKETKETEKPKETVGAEQPKPVKDPEQPKETKQPELPNEPDISINSSPLLLFFGIASGDTSAESTRQALKKMLTTVIEKQRPDGSFRLSGLAEPINSTPDVMTALTLLSLTAPNAPDLGETGTAAKEKGLAWLTGNARDNLQGMAYRLLLWRRLDRPEADWQPIVKDIRDRQNEDGGWSQIREMPSDAFATGQALFALVESGVPATDPAIVKGQAYLLSKQDENGSWPTSSRPKQRDNKPSKNLEPITYAATAWAVVSLSKLNPMPAPAKVTAAR